MLGSKEQRTEGIRRQAQELIDQAYDRGFKAGKEEFVTAGNKVADKAYQNGLDDAWECADKLNRMTIDEVRRVFDPFGLTIERESIFLCCTPNIAIAKIKAYEEQKKAEETELKVGTRVRTTKNEDYESNEVFPVGTIGVIEEIDTLRTLPYKISANGDYWFYSRDMFEVIDDEIIVGDEVIHSDMGTKAVVLNFVRFDDERIMVYGNNGIAKNWRIDMVRKTGRHFNQIAEVLKQLQEGE